MPAVILPNGKNGFVTSTGAPLVGGKLFTYDTGTNNPRATWADAGKVGANANPIILDARGEALIYWDGVYRIILQDSLGNVIWPAIDNVNGATSFTAATLGALLYPQLQSETNAGIVCNLAYPYGDVRRYNIVPDSSGAAAANQVAANLLWNFAVANGPIGDFYFPNVTGTSIYYFNNIIAFRDGCYLHLNGCTLNFTANGADATKVDAGFIYAIRNFSIEDGTIDVHYATGGNNQGHAMAFGSRNVGASTYFGNTYDSALGTPQGNIRVRNMKLTSNQPLAYLCYMTGGLRNVYWENIDLDGQNAIAGVYYEFGWATNDATVANRQTSHAHNLNFKNIRAVNILATAGGWAIGANGAYSVFVDGFHAIGGYEGCAFGTGEALYYRAWANVDEYGVEPRTMKRQISVKNAVALGCASHAFAFEGANPGYAGYLAAFLAGLGHPFDYMAESDALDCTIDGWTAVGCGGYGVRSSARSAHILNGYSENCSRGVVTTQECTFFDIQNVTVLNPADLCIQIGIGALVWGAARAAIGSIRNCFLAGATAGVAGSVTGVSLGNTQSVFVENNRFGYEAAHDGLIDATFGVAVNAGATASGVICRNNYVAAATGGSNAYAKATGPAGCMIVNPSGIITQQGIWQSPYTQRAVLAFAAAITPDCAKGNQLNVTATSGIAFTINAALTPPIDGWLTITVRNTSGGALGVLTWDPNYKLAAWVQPATGFSRSITFKYDGTNMIEVGRTAADVPN